MKRRVVPFAVLLFVILFSVFPAHAQSSQLNVTYAGGGVCNATSVSIPVNIYTNFPSLTPFTESKSVNGTVVVTFSGAQSAGVQSYVGDLGGFIPPQSFPYTYQDVATFSGGALLRTTAVCNSSGAGPIVTIDYGTGASFWNPGDDRLNRDAGQPAALYCRNGGVEVWKVDSLTSRGTVALVISKTEIDKVKNSHPARNTLIKASKDGLFNLYYLPASDELSFITHYMYPGDPYAFVFKACQ